MSPLAASVESLVLLNGAAAAALRCVQVQLLKVPPKEGLGVSPTTVLVVLLLLLASKVLLKLACTDWVQIRT